MKPQDLFIFNSSLPRSSSTESGFLQDLGPNLNGIRGVNIGNGYITYAMLKLLYGNATAVEHLPNAWENELSDSLAEKINGNFKKFVFVCQDFIREDFQVLPFSRITRFLERIKIPVVPVSLGANSMHGYDPRLSSKLSSDQRRFLSVLSQKSESIGIRGEYTAEVLHELGIRNTRVVGCPAYFENGPQRTIVKRKWDPHKTATTGGFIGAMIPESHHILQDEIPLISTLLWGERRPSIGHVSNNISLTDLGMSLALHLTRKGAHRQLQFFSDFNEWDRFYQDKDIRFTIGSRLHSAIYSLNRGVPAVVTNGDARSRESCEYLGIPQFPNLPWQSDLEEIYENLSVEKTNARYSETWSRTESFLIENGLRRDESEASAPLSLPEIRRVTDTHSASIFHEDFIALVKYSDESVASVTRLVNLSNQYKEELDREKRIQDETKRLKGELAELSAQLIQSQNAFESLQNEYALFKSSAAGKVAVRLKMLAHRFPLGKALAKKAARTLRYFYRLAR